MWSCYTVGDQVSRLIGGDELKELFKNTDTAKRDAIINAALDEFATNRYDKASTNNIVKNAGISKGLLYHYFKNKQELYDYLEFFSINTIVKSMLEECDWEESDLFLRIEKMIMVKFKILSRYPKITNFSKLIYENKTTDELKKFTEKYIPDAYYKVYQEGVDFSLFKDGTDIQRVIKMTQWVFEKLGEEWTVKLFNSKSSIADNMVELENEIFIYIKMLKEAFYK